jgi:serine phosphatase RsbU (regulator of sigma subunit)
MTPHLGLRARIAAVVGVGALIVAFGVALLLGNTVKLRGSADAALRSNTYMLGVVNLERLVIDGETGLRGYILTGRILFLDPLRSAQQRLADASSSLTRAAALSHAYQGQVAGLVAAAQNYLTSYVPDVLVVDARDPVTGRSLPVTLAGKRLVDDVRARTVALERLVAGSQRHREQAAHAAAAHAINEAIAVLVILTGLTVLLGIVLGRLVVGRAAALTATERTSRVLQTSLLPGELPQIPDLEVAVRFAPATAGDLVGGDFYDVFAVAPDRWAVVLGDVCGKGAEAAAATAMARWTLRTAPPDPPEALRFLNEAMTRQGMGARFITVAYLLIALEGDAGARVTVACAGHPAPILVPAGGPPETVDAHGTLLGVWRHVELHAAEVRLGPGDSLLAYTDGVTDQGPPFRSASPEELLRQRRPAGGAEALASTLEEYARRATGVQRDDIAIIALRYTGAARGSEEPGVGAGAGRPSLAR